MKALILVGGQATRLRPLTCNTPKAMIPVINIPFMGHVIQHLYQHQIREIVLAQGYLAEPIEQYLGDGIQFGVKLTYVVEETPLGTAGAIKNAEKYLTETFIALNGDIFTGLDITAMIAFHRQNQAKATIALTPVADPTSYGLIETNREGKVTRFLEKPSWNEVTTNNINAGTYVLEPDILERVPSGTKVSIEREVFPGLLARGEPVYAYPSQTYWIDIGTPDKYLQLHRDLLLNKSAGIASLPVGGVSSGKQSIIHPTARLTGPVVIGDNCTIERGARLIGPVVIGSGGIILEDSTIEDSIIWNHVKLGPRAHLKSSILADNCRLDADCVCEGSVLGDRVTVASGFRLEPGSKIWPETALPGKG